MVNIQGINHEIASESLLGAVDASIKEQFYGAHVCFKDTSGQFLDEFSIGYNTWTGTPYNSEARVLLEAYKLFDKLDYDRPYGKVQLWTDNKKLSDILNKTYLSNSDMA